MKVSNLSSFIAFELTPEEERMAFKYNECQVAGIQNLIAAAAEELVSVLTEVDQLSLEEQKKLAYTKGQIDILKTLLARYDVIIEQEKLEQDSQ